MGFFSWKFCNKKGRLIIGKEGYLLLPQGGSLYTSHYDGYGVFGGQDIYELLATWNRESLSELNVADLFSHPERKSYSCGEEGDKYYELAVRRYHFSVRRMNDFIHGKDNGYMDNQYGKEWLREIGIELDEYNEEVRELPYPIKVASKDVPYDSVPASKWDPMQGCY